MRRNFATALLIVAVLLFGSCFIADRAYAQSQVPQGGTGNINFGIGAFLYGNGTARLLATTSPTVGYITATSGTSTLPRASIATAINFLGDYVTNATTWIRSKIDGYLTAGQGITIASGAMSFDCSEVEGTGINCSGGNVTLDATGNWTGTFDGSEGTAYLSRSNHTGTQLAATISDFSTAADLRANAVINASTSVPNVQGLSFGDVLYWNGSNWTRTATSSLGLQFATSSADYWKSQNNFHSTTSFAYSLSQTDKGYFFSTTSASVFSAAGLAFSTSSTDYWKTQNNFFSTTSASHFSSLGLAYSTSSADAWFATKTTSNLTEGSNLYYTAARVNALISASTSIPTGLPTNGLVFIGNGTNWVPRATSTLGVALTDTTGTLTSSRGGTGSTTLTGILKGNGTGSLLSAVAGTDYVAPTSLSSYLLLSDWFATTTDVLDEGVTNLYYTAARDQRFSTTSAAYNATQGLSFSTTSSLYHLSQIDKGYFFSTTSITYWESTQAARGGGGSGWATTSSDYWKTQNNFFSTTSADYWKGLNNFFSTTSASYFSSVGLAHSTTSADTWLASKTTTNLTEGTNLYYTPARVQTYLNGMNKGFFYSTTSDLAHLATIDKGYFFSTTSANAWGATKGYLTAVGPTNMSALDFGAFTCNGSLCDIDSGAVSNSQLANSTISGISLGSNLAALTFGSTLTSSGTYNGGTARTLDINLTNANTWSGLQAFSNSGTTTFAGGINVAAINETGSASSTFVNGINLSGGCYAINGTCIGAVGGAASTTLLSDSNTFSGTTRFSNILSGILATNSNGTLGATSTPTASLFFATSTLGASVFPLASSTALTANTLYFQNASGTNATTTYFAAQVASTSALVVSNTRSAVLITSATGAVTGASATTCTNQVLTALSAVMAGTCSSLTNAMWGSGTDLSVANGGTGLSSFGSTNTILYTTAADGLSWEPAFSYVPGTDTLTVVNASTTRVSISSFFAMPASATEAPTVLGQCSIDTTNGQLKCGNGTASIVHDPRRFLTVTYATTTAWTGSTTPPGIPIPTGMTLDTGQCKTNVGTLNVQIFYGQPVTNLAMLPASTTMGTWTWATNNTPPTGTTTSFTFGTPASSPTEISCTLSFRVTGT